MDRRWLVCGGGDINFFQQLGMLERLTHYDPTWTPDAMVGTSAGAIVVGGLAHRMYKGLTFKKAVEDLTNYAQTNITKPSDLVRERSIVERVLTWPIKFFTGWDGVVSMAPLAKKLRQEAFGSAWTHTYVTLYNTVTRRTEYRLASPATILASASVPIAAAPVKGYFDGGVRDVIPLSFPIEQGASDIVALICQTAEPNLNLKPPRSFLGQVDSVISGMTREIIAADLDVKLAEAINLLVQAGIDQEHTYIRIRPCRAVQTINANIRKFTYQQLKELYMAGQAAGEHYFRK